MRKRTGEVRRAVFVFAGPQGPSAHGQRLADALEQEEVEVSRRFLEEQALLWAALLARVTAFGPGMIVTDSVVGARLLLPAAALVGAPLVLFAPDGRLEPEMIRAGPWPLLPAHVLVGPHPSRQEVQSWFGRGLDEERIHLFPPSVDVVQEQTDLLLEILEERLPSLGKRFAREAIAYVAARMPRRRHPGPSIALCYHRVCDDLRGWDPGLIVSRTTLTRQVRALCRLGLSPVTMAQQVERPAGPPSFAVTFDDGYADLLELGAPVLLELQVPFTVYVITDVLAGRIRAPWYDVVAQAVMARSIRHRTLPLLLAEPALHPLLAGARALPPSPALARGVVHAMKGWPAARRVSFADHLADVAGEEIYAGTPRYLDLAGTRRLHAAGVEIASHTVTHPILPLLSPPDLQAELMESRRYLVDLFGTCDGLAYPNGDSDGPVQTAAAAAGYRYAVAVTRQKGAVSRFNTGRRMMSEATSAGFSHRFDEAVFLARVQGFLG